MSLDVAAMRRLEPDFWRAPSAHNTQPWTLRYGDDEAEVGWDPAYALPAGDPTGRDLRLSLGAFVETSLIVCADAGLAVDFVPNLDERARRVGRLVTAAQHYRSPFDTAAVRGRVTNRGNYLPGAIPAALVTRLDTLADEAGGRVVTLQSRLLIDALLSADRHLFGDAEIATELESWLRLTPRHPNYHVDGLTERALALSRGEAFALRAALTALPLLRRLGLPRLLAAASRDTLDYDGNVLVLISPAGCGPADDVSFGRILMRMWLTLSEVGLACHPVSQIIDCTSTRARLAQLVGVADPRRLLHVARAGTAGAPAAPRARRPRPLC